MGAMRVRRVKATPTTNELRQTSLFDSFGDQFVQGRLPEKHPVELRI
jgi:hypothetical protein